MANTRIDQYPKKNNPATTDWLLLQDMSDKDVNGIGKYKKVAPNSVGENTGVGSYTYAELLQLATDSQLEVTREYLILDATAAEFNLIVQAIAVNQIGCEAKDPLYPNDKVMYNFASDVITWRWDTVSDISAGDDWRNSNTLSIHPTCTKVNIGIGCTVILGANCNNIEIGNNCTVTLFAGSTRVYVSDAAGISNPANVTQNTRVLNGLCTLDGNVDGLIFKTGTDFTTVSNKSLLYLNNGDIANGEGDFYFTYITGGVLTTDLLA